MVEMFLAESRRPSERGESIALYEHVIGELFPEFRVGCSDESASECRILAEKGFRPAEQGHRCPIRIALAVEEAHSPEHVHHRGVGVEPGSASRDRVIPEGLYLFVVDGVQTAMRCFEFPAVYAHLCDLFQRLVGCLLSGRVAVGLHTEEHPPASAVEHSRQSPRRLAALTRGRFELNNLRLAPGGHEFYFVPCGHASSIAGSSADPLPKEDYLTLIRCCDSHGMVGADFRILCCHASGRCENLVRLS